MRASRLTPRPSFSPRLSKAFILRRSAGFAYTFISLLRSEPSNAKASLLPEAMRCLLRDATSALDEHYDTNLPLAEVSVEASSAALGAVYTGESMLALVEEEVETIETTRAQERWRTAVHALNIIRRVTDDLLSSCDSFFPG